MLTNMSHKMECLLVEPKPRNWELLLVLVVDCPRKSGYFTIRITEQNKRDNRALFAAENTPRTKNENEDEEESKLRNLGWVEQNRLQFFVEPRVRTQYHTEGYRGHGGRK